MKEYVRWYHDTGIPKTGRLTDFVGLQDGESKIYIFRVAEKYGMVEVHGWDQKFYFEKVNK